jgi:hypothetical protein
LGQTKFALQQTAFPGEDGRMPHRDSQQIRDDRFTRSSPTFHRATLGHPFAGANHSAHALSPTKGPCQEPAVEHAQHEADRAGEHDADQFNETILAPGGVWTETKPSS